jgi:hypothetical protein
VDKACGAHRPGKDESVHPLPDPEWYLDHVLVPSGIDRHSVGPVRAWQGLGSPWPTPCGRTTASHRQLRRPGSQCIKGSS